MPLSTALPVLKIDIGKAIATAHGASSPSTDEQTLADSISDAVDKYVTSALLTVPGTGLIAPSGAVTGSSTTGTLS